MRAAELVMDEDIWHRQVARQAENPTWAEMRLQATPAPPTTLKPGCANHIAPSTTLPSNNLLIKRKPGSDMALQAIVEDTLSRYVIRARTCAQAIGKVG